MMANTNYNQRIELAEVAALAAIAPACFCGMPAAAIAACIADAGVIHSHDEYTYIHP